MLYIHHGYQFEKKSDLYDHSIIMATKLPRHSLERRKIDNRRNFNYRILDPQLYKQQISPIDNANLCVVLASYPWFGVENSLSFNSRMINQNEWKKRTKQSIASIWPKILREDEQFIKLAVAQCIKLQTELNCEKIILPSPLTYKLHSDYSLEKKWVSTGIDYIKKNRIQTPYYATIAISDKCFEYNDPDNNDLIDKILDFIIASGIKGAYIVIEQSLPSGHDDHCANYRTILSYLYLVASLVKYGNIAVGSNYMGPMGISSLGFGAEFWCTGYHQSEMKFNLSMIPASGRSVPWYWSSKTASFIGLKPEPIKSHLDLIFDNNLLNDVADCTRASNNLINALENRRLQSTVENWRYGPSNIASAQEHFIDSNWNATHQLIPLSQNKRYDQICFWLKNAIKLSNRITHITSENYDYLTYWLSAVEECRRLQT